MTNLCLIFFGDKNDSLNGFRRSLVSFLVLLPLVWWWFGTGVSSSRFTHLMATLALSLVIASALGVFSPDQNTTTRDVVLYSSLVGFVVFTSIVSALMVWADASWQYGAKTVFGATLICGLLGYINFKHFSKIDFKFK